MNRVHVDTHIVLWLYQALLPKLKPGLRHLEGRELMLSPMAYLELQFLYEVGKTNLPASAVFGTLAETVGLGLAESPWEDVAQTATALHWTRDPFDRFIAAHAMVDGIPLVTADERLRVHCANAVWG